MNTHTIYADRSLLTILFLSCNSSHSLSIQQVSSASHCSVILLFFCLLYRSALLLLALSFCSASAALSFCSASVFFCSAALCSIILFSISSHSVPPLKCHTTHLFLTASFFFPLEQQPNTVCFISFYTRGHNVSTSQLLGQTDDNCPANRNAKQSTTNLQS
jgi:hypothetical protein